MRDIKQNPWDMNPSSTQRTTPGAASGTRCWWADTIPNLKRRQGFCRCKGISFPIIMPYCRFLDRAKQRKRVHKSSWSALRRPVRLLPNNLPLQRHLNLTPPRHLNPLFKPLPHRRQCIVPPLKKTLSTVLRFSIIPHMEHQSKAGPLSRFQ